MEAFLLASSNASCGCSHMIWYDMMRHDITVLTNFRIILQYDNKQLNISLQAYMVTVMVIGQYCQGILGFERSSNSTSPLEQEANAYWNVLK